MPRWIPKTDADYVAEWKANCAITEKGCWEWQGWKCMSRGMKDRSRGYPEGYYRGKRVRLTRTVLGIKLGRPLTASERACHECDNPPCINPDHLWAGTQKENIQDGISKGRQQFHPSHYTHCKNGHEFTPENTRITRLGYRECRECNRIRMRTPEYRAKSAAWMRRRRQRDKLKRSGVNGDASHV